MDFVDDYRIEDYQVCLHDWARDVAIKDTWISGNSQGQQVNADRSFSIHPSQSRPVTHIRFLQLSTILYLRYPVFSTFNCLP